MDNSAKNVFAGRLAECQPVLYVFVASMMPFDRDEVADVVQQTNLAILRAEEKYDTSRPFAPWAIAIARNQVNLFYRDRKRSLINIDESAVNACADLLAQNVVSSPSHTMLARLSICRKKLPDRHRRLLEMHYEGKMTTAQIAAKLSKTKTQIHDALVYARKLTGECMRSLCRISDDSLERNYPEEFVHLFSQAVDGRANTEAKKKTLRLLAQNGAFRTAWMDQWTVHQLCAENWTAVVRKTRSTAKHWTHLALFATTAAAGVYFAVPKSPRPSPTLQTFAETIKEETDMTKKTIALLAALPIATAQAADYTWTGGESQSWDKQSANWDKGAWSDGNNAVFPSGAGNATVSESVSAQNITSTGNRTIGGEQSLTVNGEFSVQSGTTSVSAPLLAPSSRFTKNGAGTLELTGDNYFSKLLLSQGTLAVKGGTTTVAASSSDASAANCAYIFTNGTLRVENGTLKCSGPKYAINEGAEIVVGENGLLDFSEVDEVLNGFTDGLAYDKGVITIKDGGKLTAKDLRLHKNTRTAFASTHGMNILGGGILELANGSTGLILDAYKNFDGHGFLFVDGGRIVFDLSLRANTNSRYLFNVCDTPPTEAIIKQYWANTPITIGEGGMYLEKRGASVILSAPIASGAEKDGGLHLQGDGLIYLRNNNTFNGGLHMDGKGDLQVALMYKEALGSGGIHVSGNNNWLFGDLSLEIEEPVSIASNSLFRVGAQPTHTVVVKGKVTGAKNENALPTTTGIFTYYQHGNNVWEGTTVFDPGENAVNEVGRLVVRGNCELASGTMLVSGNGANNTDNESAPVSIAERSDKSNAQPSENRGKLTVKKGAKLAFATGANNYLTIYGHGKLFVDGGTVDASGRQVLNAFTYGGVTDVRNEGLFLCDVFRVAGYNWSENEQESMLRVASNGVMQCKMLYLYERAPVACIRFDGGIIRKIAPGGDLFQLMQADASWENVNVYCDKGGVVVDTSLATTHWNRPILSGCENDGGLTKIGSNYLVLTAAAKMQYNGPTVLKGGTTHLRAPENTLPADSTLVIWPGAAANLYVDPGQPQSHQTLARLEGGGSFWNSQYLTVTDAIAPGDCQGGAGTLTLGNTTALSGTLELDEGDCLLVENGTQNISNLSLSFNNLDTWDRNTQHVIFKGAYSGHFKTNAPSPWSVRYNDGEIRLTYNRGTVISLI